MTVRVVDASAIVALLFNELTCKAILPRLRDVTLCAPHLIGFEVANACLKKMRASPGESDALLEAFASLLELGIEFEPVDLTEVIAIAYGERLSVHDASYLWLAASLGSELVTLDARLAKAHERLAGVRST